MSGEEANNTALIGHNRPPEYWVKLAEAAAASLEGTCGSLYQDEDWEEGQDNSVFCARLDELVFCCDTCGWWCSMDEAHDNGAGWVCEECNDEDG